MYCPGEERSKNIYVCLALFHFFVHFELILPLYCPGEQRSKGVYVCLDLFHFFVHFNWHYLCIVQVKNSQKMFTFVWISFTSLFILINVTCVLYRWRKAERYWCFVWISFTSLFIFNWRYLCIVQVKKGQTMFTFVWISLTSLFILINVTCVLYRWRKAERYLCFVWISFTSLFIYFILLMLPVMCIAQVKKGPKKGMKELVVKRAIQLDSIAGVSLR